MSHISKSAVHCINPDCQRPYPQPWGNKFCNSCGAVLHLLDRYVPMQRLGAGGFAQIYTVWDERTQTEKVLKVLVEDSPKALELFAQEAEVLVSLRHPGVPKVETDGHFQVNLSNPKPRQLACLVMEKINGPTLADMFDKYPQGCPEELILSWLTQALKILQELHKRQIIHRDIKPSNLMLRTPVSTVLPSQGGSGWEQLVLIDFGGAKQVKLARQHPSSTRLFSSGYSPPEQVRGGQVGPEADFYALGRTMIELLTGRYPSDLEDPNTGVLQWRNLVNVRRQLADLLDEMVLEDPRSRPANAAIIQKRLNKITQPPPQTNRLQQLLTQTQQKFQTWRQNTKQAVKKLAKTVRKIFLWIVKTIWQILKACLLTIWAMLLTGVGAGVGTISGYSLAYHTNLGDLGDRLVEFIFTQLPELIDDTQYNLGLASIVFTAAGLGTAWGITASGCFGQRRRFLAASFMGIISYLLGWILWAVFTSSSYLADGLVVAIAIAVFLLALSIGFRSHRIVYAVFAAAGMALGCAALLFFGFPPTVLLFYPSSVWTELSLPVAFFSFVGVSTSFWFGVSYYLIVPTLRWLGWR
ncbi:MULTISPECIES: bifunctional serine/threonine protein kinase/MFS transporter [unclassified Anabaena]|uniref:bifunctional serine/threonine protein kinase/MFS transporter n=1 Tax=unclassified Anabaena TaxID=2619674 RepID=UPI000AE8619C|nr:MULTISPECIES: bifunctional serine/threonine protein kinase/MFS transporter [unclassified Anabaena]